MIYNGWLGGMIALGIGVHAWDADTCISKFRQLSTDGLSEKWLTKSWGIGLLARWFRGSIYQTAPLEKALKNAFPDENLFGLHAGPYTVKSRLGTHKRNRLQHTPRIAITTTVESEGKVFANYNSGGLKNYLKSNCLTWEV
jgi:hypothetical protein